MMKGEEVLTEVELETSAQKRNRERAAKASARMLDQSKAREGFLGERGAREASQQARQEELAARAAKAADAFEARMNALLQTLFVKNFTEKRTTGELILGAKTVAALERARNALMNTLRKALFELKDFFKYKLPAMLEKAGQKIADAVRQLGEFIKTKIWAPVRDFFIAVGKAIGSIPHRVSEVLKAAKRGMEQAAETLQGEIANGLKSWQAKIDAAPVSQGMIRDLEKDKDRKFVAGYSEKDREKYKDEMVAMVIGYADQAKVDIDIAVKALEGNKAAIRDLAGKNKMAAAVISQLRERLESSRMTLKEHVQKFISDIKGSKTYQAIESGWKRFVAGVEGVLTAIKDAIVKFGHFLGIGKTPEGMKTLPQALRELPGKISRGLETLKKEVGAQLEALKEGLGRRLEAAGKSIRTQQPQMVEEIVPEVHAAVPKR